MSDRTPLHCSSRYGHLLPPRRPFQPEDYFSGTCAKCVKHLPLPDMQDLKGVAPGGRPRKAWRARESLPFSVGPIDPPVPLKSSGPPPRLGSHSVARPDFRKPQAISALSHKLGTPPWKPP